MILIGLLNNFSYFEITMIKYMSLYFIAGMAASNYKKYLDKILNLNFFYFAILFLLFLILSNYYSRSSEYYYLLFGNSFDVKLFSWVYRISLAFLGILIVLKISKYLAKKLSEKNKLLYIGQNMTLSIYLTHIFFVDLFQDNAILNLLIISLYFLLFYSIYQTLSKKYRMILFGR